MAGKYTNTHMNKNATIANSAREKESLHELKKILDLITKLIFMIKYQ